MKVNHETTKSRILDILGILREQARYAKIYKQECKKVLDDDMLAEKYKTDKVESLRVAYITKHNENKAKVVALLNEIATIETGQEKILDFDIPEFANTVAVINTAKGKLPADVMEGIKLNFAGYYQVLLSIQAVFEQFDIDLTPYNYHEYTTSAGVAVLPLIHAAENIEQEETSTIVSLHKLFKDVIHFGEVRGIEFSGPAKTFGEGIDEEVQETLTRRAMGLDE